MKVTGKITRVLDVESGVSKADKPWKKLIFTLETTEDYNNLYALEVFGEEKVDNFLKFNKLGQEVDVEFNVSCNEWKGKYFTSLQAWKVFKAEKVEEECGSEMNDEQSDDLPF